MQKALAQKTVDQDIAFASHQKAVQEWDQERMQLQQQIQLTQKSLERANADLMTAKHDLNVKDESIKQLEFASRCECIMQSCWRCIIQAPAAGTVCVQISTSV